jgi:hypothetical protein
MLLGISFTDAKPDNILFDLVETPVAAGAPLEYDAHLRVIDYSRPCNYSDLTTLPCMALAEEHLRSEDSIVSPLAVGRISPSTDNFKDPSLCGLLLVEIQTQNAMTRHRHQAKKLAVDFEIEVSRNCFDVDGVQRLAQAALKKRMILRVDVIRTHNYRTLALILYFIQLMFTAANMPTTTVYQAAM